jgi:dienelactone hydrolase
MMKKSLKIILLSFIALLVLITAGFLIWAQVAYKPTKEALSLVGKKEDRAMVFGNPNAETGIIFYQGAKVEAEAYSYIGYELQKKGYFTVIPQLPLRFAIFDVNKADEIIKSYPQVRRWYIAGHSLGGAMGARYAYENKDKVAGIMFLAAYPADDLSNTSIPILSVYGERDGVATLSQMKEKEQLLSKNTTLHMIKGGNHAHFGMYGEQKGDNKSTITAKQQQKETIEVMTEWLNRQR